MDRRRLFLVIGGLAVIAVVLAVAAVVTAPKESSGGAAPAIPKASKSPYRTLNAVVIGDSFTSGTVVGGEGLKSWVFQLQDQLAKKGYQVSFRKSAHSAAGYVTRGFDETTYDDAARNDVRSNDDIVIIYGSSNDYAQPDDIIRHNVKQTIKDAEKSAPHAKILVVGMSYGLGARAPGLFEAQKQVKAGAAAEHVEFVDPLAKKWFLGKNAKYINKQIAHPTDAGHVHFAEEMQPVIIPIIKKLRTTTAPKLVAKNTDTIPVSAREHRDVLTIGGKYIARTFGGNCKAREASQLEVSFDKGATFGRVTTPAGQILGFDTLHTQSARFVGLDQSCGGPYLYSQVGKSTQWQVGSADAVWYLPVDRKTIHAPGRTVDPGCSVISLSAVTETAARVACSDGTVRGTLNGGKSWTTLGSLKGLRQVSYESPSVGAALAASGGCAAEVFTTQDGGATWKDVRSLPGAQAEALDATDTVWLALVSNAAYASQDEGTTWGFLGAGREADLEK